jgi:3-hydroxy acid dehydrogenase/malonic semialdehyde reductase
MPTAYQGSPPIRSPYIFILSNIMRKRAFISGATSGIGLATARLFAANNIDLIICGRRKDRLEALLRELTQVEVKTLDFDVREFSEVKQAFDSLPEEWKSSIDFLINNAGNAHGLDLFQEGTIDDWDTMIDTNIKGLLYVSKTVLPGMISRKSGHIINIGSIAGKETYAKGNVYCASKKAVDALTEGMRIDLIATGVKVSAINPGMVETEFSEVRFKGDKERAKAVYQGVQPLNAEDIADIILFVLTRPAHVNISDLTVLAAAQASAVVVNRQ